MLRPCRLFGTGFQGLHDHANIGSDVDILNMDKLDDALADHTDAGHCHICNDQIKFVNINQAPGISHHKAGCDRASRFCP